MDVAYFYVEQKNPLNSDTRNNWKMGNTFGVNYAKGIELGLNWKPQNSNIENIVKSAWNWQNHFDKFLS